MDMTGYTVARIKAEDVAKITQAESGIKTADGKNVILIAYESQ